MCSCSVFSVNPSTPASQWCYLLKLEQKNTFTVKRQTGLTGRFYQKLLIDDQKQEGERLCIFV